MPKIDAPFEGQFNGALDKRTEVDTLANLDIQNWIHPYPGMKVFVKDIKKFYYWNGSEFLLDEIISEDLYNKITNISGVYKGHFANAGALTSAYTNGIPNPNQRGGWFVTVASTDSMWVWSVNQNQWVDSTTAPTGGGDMFKSTYDPNNHQTDVYNRANHNGNIDTSDVTGLDIILSGKEDINNKNQNNGYAGLDINGFLPDILLSINIERIINKNQNNGYAGLDANGKILIAVLPSSVELTSNKNQNNGYAGLDANGKLASSVLPSISLTDLIVSGEANLTAYIANEWIDGTIQKGDFVKTADNLIHLLYQNNGSNVNDYTQITTANTDWGDILNVPLATISNAGIVQLSSSLTGTSEVIAATQKAVKDLKDLIDNLNTAPDVDLSFTDLGDNPTIDLGINTPVKKVFKRTMTAAIEEPNNLSFTNGIEGVTYEIWVKTTMTGYNPVISLNSNIKLRTNNSLVLQNDKNLLHKLIVTLEDAVYYIEPKYDETI